MTSLVLPQSCTSLFFHNDDNAVLNRTISMADLKPGPNNGSYAYSPNGYAVAYIGISLSANGTENTPEWPLQVLSDLLVDACSFPFDGLEHYTDWSPSFGDKPYPVSSIIMEADDDSFISLLDRTDGYMNSTTFTAYPGCLYKTNDPKIQTNGTPISPANLTQVRPVAFNASLAGFANHLFLKGFAAKYSLVLASGGAFASPEFTIDVAASNLTSSMDLQKEAWFCFQKMYASFMTKNETLPLHCNQHLRSATPSGWRDHFPCYTGNGKNDTQAQYCACEVNGVEQQNSSASAQSSVVAIVLSLLMLSVFV
ncbi:hypothetical protein HDU80_005046 [Chytriomyces hyalinus]|nr:hypothetical protein HDU80_005046 [Chytriomyces hyalinus]